MSENKRVTIPFLKKVLKPIADLMRTKADKTDILQLDARVKTLEQTFTAGTTDLTAGTSALATGTLYFVYE